MKVLQHNLNHCDAAQDLLMQTVCDWKIDVVIITDPYKPQRTNQRASDVTGKAAIWSCGKLLFQDNIDSTQKSFVRTKLGNLHFYSCYALPSLKMEEFTDLIDRLVEDAREQWSSPETLTPGQSIGAANGQTEEETSYWMRWHAWM